MRTQIAKQRDPELSDVEFCASDVRFHNLIAGTAYNSVLQFFTLAMSEALQPATNLLVFRFREREIIADQHERLLDALERKRADTAIAVLVEQTRYLASKYSEAKEWRSTLYFKP